MTDEAIQGHYGKDNVMAHVKRISDGKVIEYKLSDFPVSEKHFWISEPNGETFAKETF